MQHQKQKKAHIISRQRGDVSLWKKPRELESIDARDLDVLIVNFLYFKFERKTENNTSPHLKFQALMRV